MLNEVKSSNMSTKQRSFRDKYRNQVQGWYSGLLHVSIIYVTVFPSLVAILLFNYGIDRLGPNKAAAYHYFLAPITAITAFLFIDERLMWYHGVGTVLIFSGVYMTANAKKRVSQK